MKKKEVRIVGIEFYRVGKMIEDMLRYDTAFASDKFPNIVAYPRFKRGSIGGKFTGRGGDMWGGKPTVDRWRSFLAAFDPIPMTDTAIRNAGILATVETMCSDGWFTISHNDHQKISLKDYLQK